MNNTQYKNEWLRKKFRELRAKIGCCSFVYCSSRNGLEFAHLEKTEVKGRSRGMAVRYYDIINNPDKYTYLCKRHHKAFDEGKIHINYINSVEIYIGI